MGRWPGKKKDQSADPQNHAKVGKAAVSVNPRAKEVETAGFLDHIGWPA